jgi:hypothetical protein
MKEWLVRALESDFQLYHMDQACGFGLVTGSPIVSTTFSSA